MANKTMHHAVIGPDTFELIDQSARADVSELKNALTAVEIVDNASGAIASFADGSDGVPVKGLTVYMEPIQAGSGDPSPTNIRPISGRTGVTVTRTGVNVWDQENATKSFIPCFTTNGEPQNRIGYIIDLPSETYTVSAYPRVSGEAFLYMNVVSADGQFVEHKYLVLNSNNGRQTVTLSNGQKILIFDQQATSESSADKFFMCYFQVEVGSTATAYEAPQIQQVTLPLGQTVYGGTLDVTQGVLTVTQANITSYSGETFPGRWISSMDVYTAGGTPTTGAQVVYELAQPVTVQLTPQQMTTLLGQNNVWSDADSVAVDYVADTKRYIAKVISDALS